MPHITRALLRRRAEHNEGQLSTLEELTLHQEELEGINEVRWKACFDSPSDRPIAIVIPIIIVLPIVANPTQSINQ